MLLLEQQNNFKNNNEPCENSLKGDQNEGEHLESPRTLLDGEQDIGKTQHLKDISEKQIEDYLQHRRQQQQDRIMKRNIAPSFSPHTDVVTSPKYDYSKRHVTTMMLPSKLSNPSDDQDVMSNSNGNHDKTSELKLFPVKRSKLEENSRMKSELDDVKAPDNVHDEHKAQKDFDAADIAMSKLSEPLKSFNPNYRYKAPHHFVHQHSAQVEINKKSPTSVFDNQSNFETALQVSIYVGI